LKKLKVRQAEENVASLETKLAGLKKELAVLEEERKFYKIVTPYDGVIVTNSDTVHIWDNAGTAAAVIHKVHRGYYLYTYFEEKDIIHIPDGTKARFFSTDTGKWYEAESFEVSRSRSATGEKVYHLVKFTVLAQDVKGITLDSNVIVEVTVK
jgi:multidrug resistance efflux pump